MRSLRADHHPGRLPRPGRLLPALALSALACTTGCFRVVTEEVQVRDPRQVSVLRADGTVTLPAGAEPAVAVQKEGEYRRVLSSEPFRALAERDPAGSITLRCEGCTHDWWTTGWRPTLVTEDGALLPATGVSWSPSALTLGAEEVDLRVRTCLRSSKGRSGCSVAVEAVLATPRQNVLEIRQRWSPLPPLGAMLLGFGAGPLVAGATIATGLVGRRLGTLDRVLVATPLIGMGAAFSAAGIWHLTTPVEERVMRPGAEGE